MKIASRQLRLMIVLALLATMIAPCGGGAGAPAADGGTAATAAPGTGGGTAATAAPAGGGGTAATAAPAAGGGTANAGACSDAGKGQQITMWSPLTGPDG